jgi:hypothetical protein
MPDTLVLYDTKLEIFKQVLAHHAYHVLNAAELLAAIRW